MPYQPHTLVTIGGTMSERSIGDEIWQFGVRGFAEGGGQVADSDLDTLADQILNGPGAGGGVVGIWDDAGGCIPAEAKLKWCKAANIGPDGGYTAAPGIADGVSVGGGVALETAPGFCTVAISWTTGKTFGKGINGRIYPPNYAAGRGIGSLLGGGVANTILAWGGTLLRALDTSLFDVVWHPYVVSSSGVSNLITGLRVGDVWDTQRRRKNAVAEQYVSASFTP